MSTNLTLARRALLFTWRAFRASGASAAAIGLAAVAALAAAGTAVVAARIARIDILQDKIKVIIDGANVGRSRFHDPEYTGDARREFDLRREEAGVHCKPIHANAILAVFQHIMRANETANVEYVPR